MATTVEHEQEYEQDTEQEVSLEQLAEVINRAHDAAEECVRESVRHAREAGEALNMVKDRLPHGAFIPWVEEHCRFSYPSAVLYMKVAREWDTLCERANPERVRDLSLRDIMRILRDAAKAAEADTQPHGTDEHAVAVYGALKHLQSAWVSLDKTMATDLPLLQCDERLMQIFAGDIADLLQGFVFCRKKLDKSIAILIGILNGGDAERTAAALKNALGSLRYEALLAQLGLKKTKPVAAPTDEEVASFMADMEEWDEEIEAMYPRPELEEEEPAELGLLRFVS